MAEPNDFLTRYPNLREFMPFLNTLNKESARGAVLIACSFIDNQLESTLRAFLRNGKASEKLLTGFNAPLGSFSARITAAFALGLITDREHAECERLRKVRNEFAHKVTATFDDEAIKDHCAALTYRAITEGDVDTNARSQFTSAAIALILNLVNRTQYVGEHRRTEMAWPY